MAALGDHRGTLARQLLCRVGRSYPHLSNGFSATRAVRGIVGCRPASGLGCWHDRATPALTLSVRPHMLCAGGMDHGPTTVAPPTKSGSFDRA